MRMRRILSIATCVVATMAMSLPLTATAYAEDAAAQSQLEEVSAQLLAATSAASTIPTTSTISAVASGGATTSASDASADQDAAALASSDSPSATDDVAEGLAAANASHASMMLAASAQDAHNDSHNDSSDDALQIDAPSSDPALAESGQADAAVEQVASQAAQNETAGESSTTPDPTDFASLAADDPLRDLPQAAYDYSFVSNGTVTLTGPRPGGTATGSVPAGLESYYSQSIDWNLTTCAAFGLTTPYDTATRASRCAYVSVPLDYSDLDGRSVQIGVYMYPHDPSVECYGVLFVNPGGPGGSGMSIATHLPGMLSNAVGNATAWNHYDIVGFDPRGVGNSLPQIRCQSDAAQDAQREGGDGLTNEQYDAIDQYNAQQCYANTAASYEGITGDDFIPTVSTDTVARDMDVLRSALGCEKASYLGYSYGTRIGYYYAMQFPRSVHAMVLDGNMNVFEFESTWNSSLDKGRYSGYYTNLRSVTSTSAASAASSAGASDAAVSAEGVAAAGADDASAAGTDAVATSGPELQLTTPSYAGAENAQMASFEATFRQFLSWCLTSSSLTGGSACAVGDHVDGTPTDAQIDAAEAAYQRIARQYWGGKSAGLSDGRALSFQDFTTATCEAMYSSTRWKAFNIGLRNAKNGNGSWMMYLADTYNERSSGIAHYDPATGTWGTRSGYANRNAALYVIQTQDGKQVSQGESSSAYTSAQRARRMKEYYAAAPFADPGADESGAARGLTTGIGMQFFFTSGGNLLSKPGYEMSTLPNVLVISTTYDPATPYVNGVVNARALRGTLLIVAAARHCEYGYNRAATGIANEYLAGPDAFQSKVDAGTFGSGTAYAGSSNVTTKDVYSNVITGSECQLVSFHHTESVATSYDSLTDGTSGNKRNVELGGTSADGKTDATAEGTYITVKRPDATADSAEIDRVTGGSTVRVFLNDIDVDCTAANAGCMYRAYLYSAADGASGAASGGASGAGVATGGAGAAVQLGEAVAATSGGGGYYLDLTIPADAALGAAKIAVYRENDWLYGWQALTIVDTTTGGDANAGKTMYRLYNPNTGEHFYTADLTERANLAAVGWRDEGRAWVAPVSGDAVYRLYNPVAGGHHYTMSRHEADTLVSQGWREEGVGWYSAPASTGTAVWRVYNPNAGAHHYTTDAAERSELIRIGWNDEGVAWYALAS